MKESEKLDECQDDPTLVSHDLEPLIVMHGSEEKEEEKQEEKEDQDEDWL